MKRVLIIAGTRPEAIKIAPIMRCMQEGECGLKPVLCLTGQHPEIATEALDVFGLSPDVHLDCVPPGGDLCVTASSVIRAVADYIDELRPDAVMVQGDTLSAMAGGLSATLRRVPLAHVEAGLRSGTMDDPFPEELSRRLLSHLATWNFAPTETAVANLLAEGVDPQRIHMVGNTVIDAVRLVRPALALEPDEDATTIVITAHRRENWGEPMRRICKAVRQLVDRHSSWRFVFSLHPNPSLRVLVHAELAGCASIKLLACPGYDAWIEQLARCDLILTDSGGMQEEATALGKPVLVLRNTTERPEAVDAGAALVIGTQAAAIVRHVERIMGDPGLHASMSRPRQVFGDGFAAQRIVSALNEELDAGAPLTEPVPDAFACGRS